MSSRNQFQRQMAHEQQKDQMQFAHDRQEFNIEASFHEANFGMRFVGMVKLDEKGLHPFLRLEKIPSGRLNVLRKNVDSLSEEELVKLGFQGVRIPIKPTFFEKIFWFSSYFRKKQMMARYYDTVMRHNLIYFTFIGEQNGSLVAAVDVRKLEPQERLGLRKGKDKGRKQTIVRTDGKKTEGGESAGESGAVGTPPVEASEQERVGPQADKGVGEDTEQGRG